MIKLKKYISTVVAGLVLTSGATMALAQSGNPYHNQGDLILAFQNPGGATGADQVLLFSLGSAADLYRGQTSNTLNIANLGSLLTDTFGANWYDSGTLYVSAVSAWSSSTSGPLGNQQLKNDPAGTVYASRGRDSITGFGSAGSVGWSGLSPTNLGTASQGILQVASDLETKGSTAAVVLSLSNTAFDNQNPIALGNQGTAYGTFTGGTQFQFGAGSLGSWAGIDVEGALDLFRLQPKNNLSGQYGFGDPTGAAAYLGSLVIGKDGSISYAVVPEPGSVLLVGGVGMLFALRRRFQKAKAVI